MPTHYGINLVKAARRIAAENECRLLFVCQSYTDPMTFGYDAAESELVTGDIYDPEAIIRALERRCTNEKIIAILPGTDYVTHVVPRVAMHFGVIHTNADAARCGRLKHLARREYEKCKELVEVRWREAETLSDALAAAQSIGYPVVMKPVDCACSQRVCLARNAEELETRWRTATSSRESFLGYKTCGKFLIEEFITGPEFSVEMFMFHGAVAFSSVTEKISADLPYFVEIGHVVPAALPPDQAHELARSAEHAVHALGFTDGAFHVELRASDSGPRIVETNGRPGGDEIAGQLLVRALGVDVFAAMMDYYLGRKPDLKGWDGSKAAAIRYIIADRSARVRAVHGLEQVREREGVHCHFGSEIVGRAVNPPRDSDDRLGYVIAEGDTPAAARERARAAVVSIEIEYEESG